MVKLLEVLGYDAEGHGFESPICQPVIETTVKILNIGSSLIRIYTVCHSFYIFWRHYFIVKFNCFIFRITTVAGLGVPIFRVFTVSVRSSE